MKKLLFLLALVAVISPVFAQNNRVMLAEDCMYLGRKSYLATGNYNTQQLGIGDNRLASFHIPDDMVMQVYALPGFKGRSESFYSSVPCLPSSWRSKVSSVKIFRRGEGPIAELPAQGDKVIFYRDIKYSGVAKEIPAGSFGAANLGYLSGQISSVYIPEGMTIVVRDNANKTFTFSSSRSSLSQYGWDNRIVAGIVYSGNPGGGGTLPQGDRVIFYRDAKYSGIERDFGNGTFNIADLGLLAAQVSSIYIPRGKSVKVYDGRNNSRTFTASIPDLARYGWNDKISTGIISGGNNGTIPPQGNKVILYRDMKYSGIAKQMNTGNFNAANLGSLQNNISSIYIPHGWVVQIYDRNGRTQRLTSSISNLAQYGWDNRISAGNIYASDGGHHGDNGGGGNNQQVILYTDLNYQGRAIACAEGTTNSLGFGAGISSIRIPPGFAVVVYKGPNLTGESKTFTSSVSNLSALPGRWNDAINAVYIYRY
ncbi:hypothetical protein DC498_08035 [Terrimonas sp.]|uniref:hypothetical protein n=1 Tax=Terrimonas sp. TaxID=1914338 RepID=UPI000D52256B|nr:hypothetical protein [Terrimonas sp.]PVD52864.1 hypothetical protein DC498_08035 [Terrimonas sp.]